VIRHPAIDPAIMAGHFLGQFPDILFGWPDAGDRDTNRDIASRFSGA